MKQLLLLTIISLLKYIITQDIDALISQVESDVILIRDAYEANFKTRCSSATTCSYHSCASAAPPGRTCNLKFVTTECEKCWKPAGLLLNDFPSIKLADVYSPRVSDTDEYVKEVVKTGQSINTTFQSIATRNPDFYKWMYVGTSNGAWISYPGSVYCDKYDNRYRPWYVGAATGAKNFILVLDFSGSMQNENREDSLKSAVKLLLGTLVNADWVGIVTFSTTAKPYSTALVRATKENIDKLIAYIMGFNSSGGTNFSDAFQKTNDMIRDTVADENGSPCKTFIMFLTDGTPTEGVTDPTTLLTMIDNLTYLKTATIFAYSLGSSASIDIPQKIACMRNGIFESVLSSDELSLKMNSYYVTLSLGMNVAKPLWVEPYIDAQGLGEMSTCSIPIYDRTVSPYRLLGVAGIDIIMGDLYKLMPDQAAVKKKLLIKSVNACTSQSLNACQMNSLRATGSKCTGVDSSCTPIQVNFDQCSSSVTNAFCNTLKLVSITSTSSSSTADKPIEICCGTETCSTGGIIGGVIGGVIGLFIIIFVPVYLKVCKPKADAEREANSGNSNSGNSGNVAVNVQPNPTNTQNIQMGNVGLSGGYVNNSNINQGQSYGAYVNPNTNYNVNPNTNYNANADFNPSLNVNANVQVNQGMEYNFGGQGGAPIGPAA